SRSRLVRATCASPCGGGSGANHPGRRRPAPAWHHFTVHPPRRGSPASLIFPGCPTEAGGWNACGAKNAPARAHGGARAGCGRGGGGGGWRERGGVKREETGRRGGGRGGGGPGAPRGGAPGGSPGKTAGKTPP